VEPRHLGAIELLGKVLVAQGRYEEATAHYENLLQRTDAADLRGELAKLYARDGRLEEAGQQTERGLEIARTQAGKYPAERRHLIGFLADVDPAFAVQLAREDLELALAVDVGHPNLEQEPVELGVRQGEGAGEVERVLGRDDEEQVVELAQDRGTARDLVALADHDLYLSARRPAAARRLVESLDSAAVTIPWTTGMEAAVVVNCTPLGMRGESLPDPVLDLATGLFEMAYGWDPTPAEKVFREHGKPVADGIDLLVAQAALSFELWLDLPAPVAVMEQAARNSSRPL